MTLIRATIETGFVLAGSSYLYEKLPSMDGFLRLVVPPGHVIMTSFPYLHIGCHYADLSVYGAHRTNRSIRPEKRLLCEGSDLLPLLWIIVVITASSIGHSNFCEGYRLEVISRFYLTFTTVFVCLFVCFHFVGLFVVVWGWGLLFCFVCIGLRVFVVFFLYCCHWLLIALGFLFSLFFTGVGVILAMFSSLIDCVYIMLLYTTFYPLFCWCWYCCILILCVEIGMNVRVSVPDTMTYVVVTYVCL